MNLRSELRLALELADAADRVTVPRFRSTDLVVETKPDTTPVSEADRAAEDVIRRMLAGARPDHAVLGEEYGSAGDSDWRWIIDPIDGTKNYVRGIPVWGTLIALEHQGEIVVGVVSAPAIAHRWWAALGLGAWRNGQPIRVSAVSELENAQMSYNDLITFERQGLGSQASALARRCSRVRGFGDFWSHMMVAEGAVDVSLEPIAAVWDLAPLKIIVEEAGGRFTDLAGEPRVDGGSAVATNRLLHDEVLAAFAD